MKIPTFTRYGLRALAFLCKQKKYCSVKKISQSEKIPTDYLEKILLKLKKGKILKAKRGANGGFKLNCQPEKINLTEIFKALDEDFLKIVCINGSVLKCPRKQTCSSKKVWLKIYQSLHKTLQSTSLSQIIK